MAIVPARSVADRGFIGGVPSAAAALSAVEIVHRCRNGYRALECGRSWVHRRRNGFAHLECGRSWVHRRRNGYRACLWSAVDRGLIGVVMVIVCSPRVR
ncbi:MAG: hypothetical protein H0A75_08970 [Candidatus Methanofishera endochildressiae]|uniref:Uncharacterized protein n=1 Tax=Candidatus Methanofishera endochildressiae TaxID=2738884 RepID=A0A7Z0SDG8_9GAMM|nr:hypothetical protein [Candidatus Methanofishera endochildressiae]